MRFHIERQKLPPVAPKSSLLSRLMFISLSSSAHTEPGSGARPCVILDFIYWP
jgi:hypothetical protein